MSNARMGRHNNKNIPNKGFTKDNKNTLLRLSKYVLNRYKWQYLLVIFLIIVTTASDLYAMVFLQSLIDDYILPLLGKMNPNFDALIVALTKVGIFIVIGAVAAYIKNLLLNKITHGILLSIRTDMFGYMQKLPIGYFDQRDHGDIMSIYTADVDTLMQVLHQSIPQMIMGVVSVIGSFIAMIMLSPHLTGITMINVVIILFITRWYAKRSRKYFIIQQNAIGDVNGYMEEMVSGLQVVKVFNYEERSLKRFEKINEHLRGSSAKANSYALMIMPMTFQMANLSYVMVALIGSIFALNGQYGLTLGALVSFLTLNKGFYRPFNQFSSQMNSLIQALAGTERIFNLIDEEPEIDEGHITIKRVVIDSKTGEITPKKTYTNKWAWNDDNCPECPYKEVKGEIVFKDVNFSYVKGEQILYYINLYAKPGQKIAFVGSTGAGKTTINNLINRFYEIDSGTITYDGNDIRDIKKDDLRRSLGIVLQDVQLFSGTIMENIKYGNLEATDEECIAAAKLANAHSFIKRLPQGYDTKISGDGSSLSEGQRQLLSIARVAVANPPVLILDEATSSIDTRTEQLVSEGMDALMAGRTTFVIAHRLSTIKNSDVIMIMEAGRIIERGNHEELIAKKGRYYKLYTGKDE